MTGPVSGFGSSGLAAVAVPTRAVAGQLPAAKVAHSHRRPPTARFAVTLRGSTTFTRAGLASPGLVETTVVRVGETLRLVCPAPPTLPVTEGANGTLSQPVGVNFDVAVCGEPGLS